MCQGPSTTIDWISKDGKVADGFILPAGSMFSLGWVQIPQYRIRS